MANDINLPKLIGKIDKDTKVFSQYIKESESLLKALPARYKCNTAEKKRKDEIYAACQKIRSQFIHQHRETVYSLLTDNFSQYHRLDKLAFQAAQFFPGLVPTAAQMREEQKLLQMQKEGFEIDQGIFFHGLLDSNKIGNHLFDAMLNPCLRALALKEQMQDIIQINLGTVSYERKENTAFLTINNPKCLNAEDNQFVDDMETAVDLALLDEKVQVCVLRGGIMTHSRYEGKRVFCSGINLKDLSSGNISFVNFLLTKELGYLSKIVHGLLRDPYNPIQSLCTVQKPWIAVVDSFAIGGGMQLLLVCDKVIAAEDSYFSLPAAQEGIIPGVANYRLTQMSHNRLARQIILSGRKITATSLQAQYFCDEVVSSEAIDKAVEVSIEAFSHPAVIANRRMLNFTEECRTTFLKYMSEFAYVQATRLYSTDVLAKVSRFANAPHKNKGTNFMLMSNELHESLEDPVLDSLNFLNEIVSKFPDAISFAPGAPNPQHLQDIDIQNYITIYLEYLCIHRNIDLNSAKRLIYQYGPAKGLINELIATSLKKDKNFNVLPESIVITVGAQEAMLIVLRALFRNSSNKLAVVNPCFVGIMGAAKLLDVDMVTIEETEQGIDLGQLDRECTIARQKNMPIRALYVAPDYSNPAGTVLTLDARLQLLELAKKHQLLLIEDNAYGFTVPNNEEIPSLKALDKTNQVIFIGTFAKICLPGARVGYVIADQIVQKSKNKTHLLADDLATIKSMVTVNTSPICQALIGGMILEHNFSLASLEQERSILYRNNLLCLLSGLKQRMPEELKEVIQWNSPKGGFFIRVRLPIPADKTLLEYCISKFGVLWTPMTSFYLNGGGSHELRLSCSYLSTEQIEKGIDRLIRFFHYTNDKKQLKGFDNE